MRGMPPKEKFPKIGTVEGPAYLRCREDEVLLCYQIAPVDNGGNIVLAFDGVVYFEQNPNNVHEGLAQSLYPVTPWDFTEVVGSDRIARWSNRHLPLRFWTISFNDWTVEIVFSGVRKVHEARGEDTPDTALLSYLATLR